MKRKFIAVLAILIAAMGSAFAKKQKQASSDSELVDWQGKEVGIKSTELPSWLRAVALGNKEDVKQDLKVEDKKMIFVLTRSGDDLDFLKAWVDQIDARSEVAAALETTVAQTVQDELTAAHAGGESEIQQKASIYSAQMTNLTLNGLEKLTQYWTKTRTLKLGLKKAKTAADYDYKITYYVVFGMDDKLFKTQLAAAMDDVPDNDDQTKFLRQVLTAKVTGVLLPDVKVDLGGTL